MKVHKNAMYIGLILFKNKIHIHKWNKWNKWNNLFFTIEN